MKKVIYCLLILVFVVVIICAVFKNTKNLEIEVEEYVPEEEISNSQNRTTLLTLYFLDLSSGELVPEIRQIDVKDIIDNPYEKIMNLLLEGSQNTNIGKTIPEGTKVNSIVLDNENLIIDLSEEFIKNYETDQDRQVKIIYSVVDTFLELKEVSSVSFLINGEKREGMMDSFVKLEEN